jgi:hypothetical protein
MTPPNQNRTRRGYALVEVLVASGLFVAIFLASIALVERDHSLSRSMLNMAHVELMSQEMLFDLERELANARGENPVASISVALDAGAGDLIVDSTIGFPVEGTLLIDRGTPNVEYVEYSRLEDTSTIFTQLVRGVQCTSAKSHDFQAEVLWTGLAEPLEQQSPPPDPEDYDGIAAEDQGDVYFRGDGIGFSYRVPVIPPGEDTFLDGNDLYWGATVQGGAPSLTGWCAIYFEARKTYAESESNHDVNGDGDQSDTFDVGQLRKATWDYQSAANEPSYLDLGPTAILQERCNWGADLDADGRDDPIFLWDKQANVLHVRLFLIGLSEGSAPVTRMVESVLFLRNEPEQ